MVSGAIRLRRLCLVLWLAGMAAVLSLLAAPLELLQPAGLTFAWWQFRLLALVNPLLLVSAAVALGCWASRRVGLAAPVVAAWLDGEPAWPALRRQLPATACVGVIVALVLTAYAVLTAPLFAGSAAAQFAMPIVTKLLYGGVVEELMLRWGLMSLLVLVAWKLARTPTPRPTAYWTAIVLAALVFAAGHLPALYALVAQPRPALIAAVVVGNAVPGVLFGWLFWRRGLEAAVLAHALAHLLFTLGGALLD